MDREVKHLDRDMDRLQKIVAAHRGENTSVVGEWIARYLQQHGDMKLCKGCPANIFWVRHANGKAAPYNITGESHFATCPNANQFRGEN